MKSRVFAAGVVSLALVLSGCARGKPVDVVAMHGPCPGTYPSLAHKFSLKAENTGVGGVGSTLVPLSAREVRICHYAAGGGSLAGTAVLNRDAAARFVAATNRLGTRTSEPTRRLSCRAPAISLLTFTTATRGVDIAVADCGPGIESTVSNGTVTVDSTRAWLDEVAGLTAKQSERGGSAPVPAPRSG